jgi:hypothetical protein
MSNSIVSLSGYEVKIVEIPQLLWISVAFPHGWIPILKKLEQTIDKLLNSKPSAALMLIGHSMGGVLGSLYLSAPPAQAIKFQGRKHIRHLVTLGSPHQNQCRWLHGGPVSRTAAKWVSANPQKGDVRITCVAGKAVRGIEKGTLEQRKAFTMYKKIIGVGNVWGDGIIPIPSALLPGSEHIILDNVGHFSRSGYLWYGSTEVVSQWWPMLSLSEAYLRKEALEKI